MKKALHMQCFFYGVSSGNIRTHYTAVFVF